MCENIKNYNITFLKEVFLKCFLISCVVWGFMIVQFWWGNHDWGYLKNSVKFQNGFFEARYSQHLFTVLFFDGQVLPVLTILGGIIALVATSVLLASYLELPQQKRKFYIFVLFVSLNPYVFIFFYYLHYCFQTMVWNLVGICGLLLCEKKYSWKNFLFCVFIWFLLLGSYPPIIALILTIFAGRRLICNNYANEDFREIVLRSVYLGGQFIFAFIGFEVVYKILAYNHLLNMDMYNIKTHTVKEIIANIPAELIRSIGQLFDVYTFLGLNYCLLLFVFVISAIFLLFSYTKRNRLVLSLLLIGMFLASRFSFLIASEASIGIVRLEYFGRLGLIVFALGVVARIDTRCVQNLYLLWGIVTILFFIKTDFEIQKLQYLGFDAGRKYQTRLVEGIERHPKFEKVQKYIAFSFGYPNLRKHFLDDKYQTSEMVGFEMVFGHDYITGLFWEDRMQPVAIGVGINGKSVLRVDRSNGGAWWRDTEYWQNNPENMKNIRYWLYQKAKLGSVYVDDKYIILVLDMLEFYKHRELLLTFLDKR